MGNPVGNSLSSFKEITNHELMVTPHGEGGRGVDVNVDFAPASKLAHALGRRLH